MAIAQGKSHNIVERFNQDPDTYHTARRGYGFDFISENFEQMRRRMGKPHAEHEALHVLDVGAGTGQLGDNYLKLGCKVTFVEPSAKSVAYLHKKYDSNTMAAIVPAHASDTGLPPHSVDIMTFGDSAHWIKPTELPELKRLLKPQGMIAAYARLWSQVSPVTRKTDELLADYMGREYTRADARLVRNLDKLHRRYGEHLVDEGNHMSCGIGDIRTYDQQGLLDYFRTASFSTHAVQNDPAGFTDAVIKPLWQFAEKENLLNPHGQLRLPYETRVMFGPPRELSLVKFGVSGPLRGL